MAKKTKQKHTEFQKLPCKLTAEERERKTQDLVLLEQDEAKRKAEKKAAVQEMNAGLKLVRSQIEERVKELSEGTELREVEVAANYDFTAKKVRYIRLDTNEEVDSRDMDSFDLQENIAYEGDLLPPPATPQPRHELVDEEPAETAAEGEEPPRRRRKVVSIAERRAREAKAKNKGKGRKKS